MMDRKKQLPFLLLMMFAIVFTSIGAVDLGRTPPPPPTVKVQLLAFNDFHGALEPPSGSAGRVTVALPSTTVDAGGVEYLAAHVKTHAAENPNTLLLGGGDLIGASPLISALFHEESTIEAMNLMGMDFSTVGNHEFDKGYMELLRLQQGGAHPDGDADGDPYYGADFQYLSSNIFIDSTGKRLFPAYKVVNFNGVRVGLIASTYEATPTIVTPAGVAGLRFESEIAQINAAAKILKRMKVKTIVVLIHNGGAVPSTTLYNECAGLSGDILPILEGTDPEIDVFITGHTHGAYNCNINGRIVTGAMSNGRILTDIDLTISRKTGNVIQAQAANHIVTRTVAKDAAMSALVTKYKTLTAPIANQVVGSITANITRTAGANGESPLGDVIADAQLADTTAEGAVIAFMNPGGIRADLTYAQSAAGEGDGNVTYGEAFTVQPFYNYLTTIDLKGSDIKALLEQQFDNPSVGQMRVLQISNGFTYTWSASAAKGSKVSNMALGGVPIDLDATYRVTCNNFLASGGDNFTAFTAGTNLVYGRFDIDAFADYLADNSPVAPPAANRITAAP